VSYHNESLAEYRPAGGERKQPDPLLTVAELERELAGIKARLADLDERMRAREPARRRVRRRLAWWVG